MSLGAFPPLQVVTQILQVTALASEPESHTTVSDSATRGGAAAGDFRRAPVQRATPDYSGETTADERLRDRARRTGILQHRARGDQVRVMIAPPRDVTAVAETVMPDCAFIVDSMLEYFHANGAPAGVLLHPVFLSRATKRANLSFETAGLREQPESSSMSNSPSAPRRQRAERNRPKASRAPDRSSPRRKRLRAHDRAGAADLR